VVSTTAVAVSPVGFTAAAESIRITPGSDETIVNVTGLIGLRPHPLRVST
jgi:hypothetical protein